MERGALMSCCGSSRRTATPAGSMGKAPATGSQGANSETVGDWIVDHPSGVTARYSSEHEAHRKASTYGAFRVYKATN